MLEAIVKGWVTTIIALLGLLAIIAHVTGYYEFPNPEFLSKPWEALMGATICLLFLRIPRTTIDAWLESIGSSLVNFTKKKIDK